jgi:predicted protein tyrosine phosphatase
MSAARPRRRHPPGQQRHSLAEPWARPAAVHAKHYFDLLNNTRTRCTLARHCSQSVSRSSAYRWFLSSQLGMLERGLQVRGHAVYEVAVRALQNKRSDQA